MVGAYMLAFGLIGAAGLVGLKYVEVTRGRRLAGTLRRRGDLFIIRMERTFNRFMHDLDESAAHRLLLVLFQKVALFFLWVIKGLERRMRNLLKRSRAKHEELKREPSSAFLKDVKSYKDALERPKMPEL